MTSSNNCLQWSRLSATVRSVRLRHSQHRRSRHSDVIVQLLPVVGNVGIGGVADDVIVEEDEQETVSLRVDLVDEQPPKLDRAPGSRRRSDSAPESVLYPGESP